MAPLARAGQEITGSAGILKMVGLAGLEPATFRPPDGRATRLRHSPTPDKTLFTGTVRGGKRKVLFRGFACDRAMRAGRKVWPTSSLQALQTCLMRLE